MAHVFIRLLRACKESTRVGAMSVQWRLPLLLHHKIEINHIRGNARKHFMAKVEVNKQQASGHTGDGVERS